MVYALLTILGIIGIVKSSSIFVDQAIALSKKLKISSFIVGFTIVAFGTSLPELVISLYASFTGYPSIAISNVIGSNITNICLILGLLAIYRPYKLTKQDVFFNIPLNLAAITIFLIIITLHNWVLTFIGGLLLILVFVVSLVISKRRNIVNENFKSVPLNYPIMIISLFGLIFFGKVTVDCALEFSKVMGISESVLGFFIIAIGTSLPELVTSFTAIRKGNSEMGIGNILGSNLFNLLFILGSSAIIKTLDFNIFIRQILLLTVINVFLVVLAFVGKKFYFTRFEGFVLFCFYLIFALSQFIA